MLTNRFRVAVRREHIWAIGENSQDIIGLISLGFRRDNILKRRYGRRENLAEQVLVKTENCAGQRRIFLYPILREITEEIGILE